MFLTFGEFDFRFAQIWCVCSSFLRQARLDCVPLNELCWSQHPVVKMHGKLAIKKERVIQSTDQSVTQLNN